MYLRSIFMPNGRGLVLGRFLGKGNEKDRLLFKEILVFIYSGAFLPVLI